MIYQATRDSWDSSVLWKKTYGYNDTFVLVKSNTDNIFGGYSSVSWEDTSDQTWKIID